MKSAIGKIDLSANVVLTPIVFGMSLFFFGCGSNPVSGDQELQDQSNKGITAATTTQG